MAQAISFRDSQRFTRRPKNQWYTTRSFTENHSSMAGSIDKTSIRKQLDDLKASFEQQVQSNTVAKDTVFLFNSLFALIDIILAVFMERQTKKNSRNSSIPPSQTEPDESSSLDDSRSPSSKKRKLNKGTFSNQSARVSQRTINPSSWLLVVIRAIKT